MKAEADPNKINNISDSRLSRSRTTLGQLLRDWKKQTINTKGSVSSSSTGGKFGVEKLAKIRGMYEAFESGKLTEQGFRQKLSAMQIKPSPEFEKIIRDPKSSYNTLLKSLKQPGKDNPLDEHYTTPKPSKFHSSTSLTTLGSTHNAPASDFDIKQMN